MSSTVYLIGAGLTRSLQMKRRVPLMVDFVHVMTDYIAHNDTVLTALVEMEKGLVYGAPCDECYQLANEIGDDVKSASKEQRTRFKELVASRRRRESIETIFFRVLAAANLHSSGLQKYFTYAINQVFAEIGWELRTDVLERFLRSRFQPRDSTHTFISFNYDLALDRAVERAGQGLWQPRSGYGFEFPSYITSDPGSDSPRDSARALPCHSLPGGSERFRILKPHGSLNWLCRVDRSPGPIDADAAARIVVPLDVSGHLRYFGSTKTFNHIDGVNHLARRYEIVIVPPLPNKPPLMACILDKERTAIQEADEVFVIGYSLPQTDVDQRNLIREAVESRKEPIQSLTIVNYQASLEYFDDIEALFRTPARRFNSGFVDFAASA